MRHVGDADVVPGLRRQTSQPLSWPHTGNGKRGRQAQLWPTCDDARVPVARATRVPSADRTRSRVAVGALGRPTATRRGLKTLPSTFLCNRCGAATSNEPHSAAVTDARVITKLARGHGPAPETHVCRRALPRTAAPSFRRP